MGNHVHDFVRRLWGRCVNTVTNSGKTAAKLIRRIKALSKKPKSSVMMKKNGQDTLAEDDNTCLALF